MTSASGLLLVEEEESIGAWEAEGEMRDTEDDDFDIQDLLLDEVD